MPKQLSASESLSRGLNERQRTYLQAIYRLDQEREADERGAWNRGQRVRPANEWRWIDYSTSESLLRFALQQAKLVDEGTGSTFDSLERRGLIACRDARDELGVPLLFVHMTAKGRKLIRSLTGEQREKPLPPGTLREWHWKALVAAYQAGSAGLEKDSWGYGRISWKTWLRLRDYRYDRQEQPLIAEVQTWVQVRRQVFTGKGPPNTYEERTVTEWEYRLHLTPFGRTFYQQHWQHYRHLYPEVEAPEPTAEDEAQP